MGVTGPLNGLTAGMVEAALARARASERRRAVHCLHAPGDRLQRMVNAALRDTYVRPHRHADPDKLEIFTILRGKVAVVTFAPGGALAATAILDPAGPCLQAEVPPRAWHGFVVLSGEAALYEVIDGAYDPGTHKDFAPWAPAEADREAAAAFLADLRGKLDPGGGAAD